MKNFSFLFLTISSFFMSLISQAQVSGIVFRDYNANGTRQNTASYAEPLAQGVIVNAYNSTNTLVASFTSTNSGYSIPASGTVYNGTPGSNTGFAASTTALRLEFIIPSSGCVVNNAIDFASGGASAYGSSVRFVTAGAGAVNINFALNNPSDYVKNNPSSISDTIFISKPVSGNPAGAGTSAAKNVFYKFSYTNEGNTSSAAGGVEPPGAVALATNAQIGTCYGVGYSPFANKVFTSAVMKRHAGFGPANGTFNNAPGAIYIINPNLTTASPAASYFTSLDALGFPTHNSTGSPAYGSGTSYNIAVTGTNGYRVKVTYPANGLGVIGDNVTRGLPAAFSATSNDPAALGQIGKVSLGDLEVSEDGQFLYVINLYDRKLYKLQLNSVSNPTSATVVGGYNLPDPPLRSASGITNAAATYTGLNDNTGFYDGVRGYQRPYAIAVNRGKVYVGAVTTGEVAGTSTQDNNAGNPEYTDLWSYVYEFDPATNTFTTLPALQVPLNFNRGTNTDNMNETWKVWRDSIPAPANATTESGTAIRYIQYQQPILADIAFDSANTMILGFRDRFGDQTAYDEPSVNGLGRQSGQAMGDMYRVFYNRNTCAFEMETNGKEGANSSKAATAGAGNANGPGGGEFYYRDHVYDANDGTPTFTFHLNTLTGSLAIIKGSDSVAVTTMDPIRAWSGGVSWHSNTTGDNGRDYEMFSGAGTGDFPVPVVGEAGKSNGLGDIEMLTYLTPIEIGNRVWADTDNDGIQDAGEAGLGGVEMELLNSGGTVIATVTTAADGSYHFTSAPGTSVTGITYGVSILPNTTYTIRVKGTVTATNTITGNAGLGVSNYLTAGNVAGNGAAGLSDNDGIRTGGTGGTYQASVTTGSYGQNNHSVDFGFAALNVLPVKLVSFTAQPQAANVLLNWEVTDQVNINRYIIEVSTNGTNFTAIKSVDAGNLAKYTAIDANPAIGLNYYRLKIVDNNGIATYSDIRKVKFGKAVTVSVFPNPAGDVVNVIIAGNMINKAATISVFAADGKMMINKKLAAASQIETVDVSTLANGKYIIRVVTKNEVINKAIEIIR